MTMNLTGFALSFLFSAGPAFLVSKVIGLWRLSCFQLLRLPQYGFGLLQVNSVCFDLLLELFLGVLR